MISNVLVSTDRQGEKGQGKGKLKSKINSNTPVRLVINTIYTIGLGLTKWPNAYENGPKWPNAKSSGPNGPNGPTKLWAKWPKRPNMLQTFQKAVAVINP